MSKSEVESLRKRSREYMETYQFHLSKNMYALAMFDLEQALQLYVKAKLLEEGVLYPKTHNVRRLLELLAEIRNDGTLKKMIKDYAVELKLLEEAYIASRYVATEFKKDEVLKVEKVVNKVVKHG
ncbi:HEPN domain-containing protein [Candidatus Bathyarchaeota archaeon]|nr:MAG: HEPN domain-containing protein [Candidatus Bathyarchaeota archaeon]